MPALDVGTVIAVPLYLACIHARLGDTDAALAWLEGMRRMGNDDDTFFAALPCFSSLAGDPRFAAFAAGLKQRAHSYDGLRLLPGEE